VRYPLSVDAERALVVFAHPDDAEFLCGGTIALWVRDGMEVDYVSATDGSAGWNGSDLGRDEIAAIRERELRDAADILGVRSVTFLGFRDGSLEPGFDLRRSITRQVRRARPDVIVTFDPSVLWAGRRYINHPDHRAVGEAVLAVCACDAPTRPQFPELLDEGFEPFKVPRLWLATENHGADTTVDIGGTLDLKVKALKAHRSQLENMGELDIDGRIREWAAHAAKGQDFEYGETFRTFELEDRD
jgi:LmbE family N-acetylglucosaminyl deacetylase